MNMDTINFIVNKFNLLKEIDEIGKYIMPIQINEFTRNNLAELFAELGFQYGAEIGVEQGVYSDILLRENPKLTLTGVDAWKAYDGYRDHTRQAKLDKFYQTTLEMLKPYGDRSILLPMFSMQAINVIRDESLDFVYIDANHDFAHVTEDIFHWSKKVRSGGIIAGHDYYTENIPSHVHVPYVLEGYTKAYNIKPWFIFEDSWMFVKQ